MLYPPRSTWSWEAQFCNLIQNPSRRRRVVGVVQSSSPHQLVWWWRLQMGYSSGIHQMLHIRRKDATAEWNKECSSSSWQSKECTIRPIPFLFSHISFKLLSVFQHLVQAPFCLPTSPSPSFKLLQASCVRSLSVFPHLLQASCMKSLFCFPTSPFKLLQSLLSMKSLSSVFPHLLQALAVSFLFEKLGKRERTAWMAVYYYYANLASDLRFRERAFLRSMGHPSSTKLSSAINWVGEEQQVPFRRARAVSLKLGFEAQQRFSQI